MRETRATERDLRAVEVHGQSELLARKLITAMAAVVSSGVFIALAIRGEEAYISIRRLLACGLCESICTGHLGQPVVHFDGILPDSSLDPTRAFPDALDAIYLVNNRLRDKHQVHDAVEEQRRIRLAVVQPLAMHARLLIRLEKRRFEILPAQ